MSIQKVSIGKEICYCCGGLHRFLIIKGATLLREAVCENCGASIRNSDVMGVLKGLTFQGKPFPERCHDLKILNTSSYGGVHKALFDLPDYQFSEFCPIG